MVRGLMPSWVSREGWAGLLGWLVGREVVRGFSFGERGLAGVGVGQDDGRRLGGATGEGVVVGGFGFLGVGFWGLMVRLMRFWGVRAMVDDSASKGIDTVVLKYT